METEIKIAYMYLYFFLRCVSLPVESKTAGKTISIFFFDFISTSLVDSIKYICHIY